MAEPMLVVRKWPLVVVPALLGGVHVVLAVVLILGDEPLYGAVLFLPAVMLIFFAAAVWFERLEINDTRIVHYFPFQPTQSIEWSAIRGVKVGGHTDATARVPMVNFLDHAGNVVLRFDRPAFLPDQWDRFCTLLSQLDKPLSDRPSNP